MRTIKRHSGRGGFKRPDPHITMEKYNKLKEELKELKEIERPPAIREVKRLAEMGDFSENAAYQIAKGRLRSINNRITKIKDFLSHAEIISAGKDNDKISLGSRVTLEINGEKRTYKILGSAETDPGKGIISHNSPLGKNLIGRAKGETVKVKVKDRFIEYKIIEISS
ncbi:MAG: GreA/GreB family elongation factor [Patescibacteria group bacterium]